MPEFDPIELGFCGFLRGNYPGAAGFAQSPAAAAAATAEEALADDQAGSGEEGENFGGKSQFIEAPTFRLTSRFRPERFASRIAQQWLSWFEKPGNEIARSSDRQDQKPQLKSLI